MILHVVYKRKGYMKVGAENEKNSKPKHINLNFQLCFISFFFLITCLLLSEFEISSVLFLFFLFFLKFKI
jgi:hypothetical protein